MSEFDRFVGIDYADKGRGPDYDCWGLFAFVLKELKGIVLPSYSDKYNTAEDKKEIDALIAEELSPWIKIEDGSERPFDGLLMKEAGYIRHIGLVVQPGLVLHIQRNYTSEIEHYDRGPLKYRKVGFYRHRDLE